MAHLLSGCLADCSFFPDPHGPVRLGMDVRDARAMSDVIIRSAIDVDGSGWASRGVLDFNMVPLSPRYTSAQLFPEWAHPFIARLEVTSAGASALRQEGGLTLRVGESHARGSLCCCYIDAEARVHCCEDGVVAIHLSSERYPRFWVHASAPMPEEAATRRWASQ